MNKGSYFDICQDHTVIFARFQERVCCVVLLFNIQVNNYGHILTVSYPNHTFLGQERVRI